MCVERLAFFFISVNSIAFFLLFCYYYFGVRAIHDSHSFVCPKPIQSLKTIISKSWWVVISRSWAQMSVMMECPEQWNDPYSWAFDNIYIIYNGTNLMMVGTSIYLIGGP